MAPKPFPFPIGVGIDICRISRIAAILRSEQFRNRWARRVFTRLEWSALGKRFQRAQESKGESLSQSETRRDQPLGEDSNITIWMVPKLSKFSSILDDQDQTAYWSAVAEERSALGNLVRHLAGRWAAKEAAIKAHRHRQLYMQDVSIVRPRLAPGRIRLETAKSYKMHALIEPPCNTIVMDERVAKIRELRGFGARSVGLHKGGLMSRGEVDDLVEGEEKEKMQKPEHFERRSKVKESDRQVAEINISHDGDYAVAVCMASDPPGLETKPKRIVDKGEGDSIHEPQWGDEGWFELDEPSSDDQWLGMDKPLDDLLGESEQSSDSEASKKAFKEAFESTASGFGRIPFLP